MWAPNTSTSSHFSSFCFNYSLASLFVVALNLTLKIHSQHGAHWKKVWKKNLYLLLFSVPVGVFSSDWVAFWHGNCGAYRQWKTHLRWKIGVEQSLLSASCRRDEDEDEIFHISTWNRILENVYISDRWLGTWWNNTKNTYPSSQTTMNCFVSRSRPLHFPQKLCLSSLKCAVCKYFEIPYLSPHMWESRSHSKKNWECNIQPINELEGKCEDMHTLLTVFWSWKFLCVSSPSSLGCWVWL